jgi:putative sigma-54 modulation protein
MTIKGREATDNMYSAIDIVMEKIEKQVKKHKERLVSHKAENVRGPVETVMKEIEIEQGQEEYDEEDEEPSIITRTINSKPMTVEEAAMQLDVSSSEFLVFINADTKEMNVIYRRRDNHYGHIVPKTNNA